jgi:hypothetical protein
MFEPQVFRHWKAVGLKLQDTQAWQSWLCRTILFPRYTKQCKLMKNICKLYDICSYELQHYLEELLFANIDDRIPETAQVIFEEMSDNVLSRPTPVFHNHLLLKVFYPIEKKLENAPVGYLDCFWIFIEKWNVFLESIRPVCACETLKTKRDFLQRLRKAVDRAQRALQTVTEIVDRDHTQGLRVRS